MAESGSGFGRKSWLQLPVGRESHRQPHSHVDPLAEPHSQHIDPSTEQRSFRQSEYDNLRHLVFRYSVPLFHFSECVLLVVVLLEKILSDRRIRHSTSNQAPGLDH